MSNAHVTDQKYLLYLVVQENKAMKVEHHWPVVICKKFH